MLKPVSKRRRAAGPAPQRPRPKAPRAAEAAPPSDPIVAACEKHWDTHKSDCSGFVRAVAAELGVALTGNADAITAAIRGDAWTAVADGAAAATTAAAGELVLAGLKGSEQSPPSAHGHVVVVVAGDLAHGRYPNAWWGRLGSVGDRNKTINWAWNAASRDLVSYGSKKLG